MEKPKITKNLIVDEIKRYGYAAIKSRYGYKVLQKFGLLSRLDKVILKNGGKIEESKTIIL